MPTSLRGYCPPFAFEFATATVRRHINAAQIPHHGSVARGYCALRGWLKSSALASAWVNTYCSESAASTDELRKLQQYVDIVAATATAYVARSHFERAASHLDFITNLPQGIDRFVDTRLVVSQLRSIVRSRLSAELTIAAAAALTRVITPSNADSEDIELLALFANDFVRSPRGLSVPFGPMVSIALLLKDERLIDRVSDLVRGHLSTFEIRGEVNVRGRAAVLTNDYLSAARACMELTSTARDYRIINGALKLLSAVTVAINANADPSLCGVPLRLVSGVPYRSSVPASAAYVDLVSRTTAALSALHGRALISRHALPKVGSYHMPFGDKPQEAHIAPRLTVLTHERSRTFNLLAAELRARRVPFDAVIFVGAPRQRTTRPRTCAPLLLGRPHVQYSTEAWYPSCGTGEAPTSAVDSGEATASEVAARMNVPFEAPYDIDEWLSRAPRAPFEFGILAGMPILSSRALSRFSLGLVNAHNGYLPNFRGMDAAAWAIIEGWDVYVTVHIVADRVDAGDVVAIQHVEVSPNLKRIVKDTQVRLLADTAVIVAYGGKIPILCSQSEAQARTYYRMHPALREVADRVFMERITERRSASAREENQFI